MKTINSLLIGMAALMLISSVKPAQAAIVTVNCANNSGDAATINNAVSASNTGDWIQIHGTCSINATIVLASGRSYTGDQRFETLLQQAAGTNLTAVVASDSWYNNSTFTGSPITIAHLTIDGNSSFNTGTTCLVVRNFASTVEDLHLVNCPGDGLLYSNVARNGTTMLSNTSVNDTFRNLFIDNSGGNGFHVSDGGNSLTDSNLESSWIGASGESAVYMDNVAGWRIVGNHLYTVGQHAIYANRCFSTTIADNYIEDFGDTGGSGQTYYGIGATLQGNEANAVISGNKVNFQHSGFPSTGTYVYIDIIHGNYGTSVATVSDNVIYGQGTSRETGLSYNLGAATAMHVYTGTNNVNSVGTNRSVGAGVTLVTGL